MPLPPEISVINPAPSSTADRRIGVEVLVERELPLVPTIPISNEKIPIVGMVGCVHDSVVRRPCHSPPREPPSCGDLLCIFRSVARAHPYLICQSLLRRDDHLSITGNRGC